jgi:hypothetical protein
MTEQPLGIVCKHACSFGCGREYDLAVIQVIDSSTLFLCIPDFLNFAKNVATAMVEPENMDVVEISQSADLSGVVIATTVAPDLTIRGNSDPAPDDEFDFDGVTSE